MNPNQFNPFSFFANNPFTANAFGAAPTPQKEPEPQVSNPFNANPWLTSWLQMADSWQKHWGQAYNFNGFADGKGFNTNNISQLMNWQPNMPVLSFDQIFDPNTWDKLSNSLQSAWQQSDRKTVEQVLRSLSEQWISFSHTHQPFWRKQALSLQKETVSQWRTSLDKNPWLNFPQFQEGVKESRNYLEAWHDCLESASSLADYFESVEQEVSEAFVAKVLDENINIEDVKELFGQWVKVFEDLYHKACMQEEYRKLYTQWTKTLLSFREFIQESVDTNVELWGLPSKREMDTLLQRTSQDRKNTRKLDQRVVVLEQQVEQLGRELEALKKSRGK